MSQLENHPFVCPYHGRVKDQDVTTQKSCARCMNELGVDAGQATALIRAPYEGHKPKHQYDCGNCKFAWCCGPQCACNVSWPQAPKQRMKEVKRAQKMIRGERL